MQKCKKSVDNSQKCEYSVGEKGGEPMINFDMLEKKMQEKNISRDKMIEELGINESTWYRKKKQPQSFTIGAAETIIKVLELSEKEANDIFNLLNISA